MPAAEGFGINLPANDLHEGPVPLFRQCAAVGRLLKIQEGRDQPISPAMARRAAHLLLQAAIVLEAAEPKEGT